MKVILLSRVEGVGEAGHVVEVSDGYARNVLFPKGLAAAATAGRERAAREEQERARKTSEEELAQMQALAETLDGSVVTIYAAVGPQGKLHGSVTGEMILAAMKNTLATSIPDGARARLREPIHVPGEYRVTLELPHGLETTVVVLVEPEEPSGSQP